MPEQRRPTRRRGRRPPLCLLAAFIAAALSLGACALSPDVGVGVAHTQEVHEKPELATTFDGETLDTSVWNTCHWWAAGGCTIASNHELEWYLPEQVSVAGGSLRLTATRRDVTAPDGKKYRYASGMVTTGPPTHGSAPKFAFTYGTVEAKFRAPAGRGMWSAIWLLPASEESRPEVDLLEILGNDPSRLIMHLHPQDRSVESPGKTIALPHGETFASDWHTVRLEWRPDELVFFVDDKEVWRVTGPQVPSEPMYLVMNLAVGGDYPGPPNSSTTFPATFSIDSVRIRESA